MKIGIGVEAVPKEYVGIIDGIATHPDGAVLYRINDHWWFSHDLELRNAAR